MPKIYSLSSSDEDEIELSVKEVKNEANTSLNREKISEKDVLLEDSPPKRRSKRSRVVQTVKIQIVSDESDINSNDSDSDYEPEVEVKAKTKKRKNSIGPGSKTKKAKAAVKAGRTKKKTEIDEIIPPSIDSKNNKVNHHDTDEISSLAKPRKRPTRWDSGPVATQIQTETVPIKRTRNDLLSGEHANDNDEMEGTSKKIKLESSADASGDIIIPKIEIKPEIDCKPNVSAGVKIEGRRRSTASKTSKPAKTAVKKEKKSMKTDIDEGFSASTSCKFNDDGEVSGKYQPPQQLASGCPPPSKAKNEPEVNDIKVNKLMQVDDVKRVIAWEEAQVLAEDLGLDYWIARNIVRLLDEDNTIPFIARYRKEMTGHMPPEDLRKVKEAYETLKNVKVKADALVETIKKMGKLTVVVEREILSARSMGELEHIKASYKTAAKGTLADRARELGLETPAVTILYGNSMEPLTLEQFVCHQRTKGLATVKDVQTGLQHIMADLISKDRDVQDMLRKLKNSSNIFLSCTKSKSASKPDPKKASKKSPKKGSAVPHKKTKEEDEDKYQNYFSFKNNVRFIKPHQILAINRGEKNKFLSVKVEVPGFVKQQMRDLVQRRWLNQGIAYPLRGRLVENSFDDAYERLLVPLVVRLVRSELTQLAETASIEVFAANLKNLLLQPPLRGKVVMGLDPGFKNGCKLAVISPTGDVLCTDVLRPKFGFKFMQMEDDYEAMKLRRIAQTYRCETIGLGNGTACRETEEYLSTLIQLGCFRPLDVVYTIVSEQGASIYSCSPEAQKEFPQMDTNLISAVSIARRLQDPLAELVKIEARHLGVGMYQHDISDTKLRSSLDEVVVECVSFVGVDLNAASQCILRKISGLNATRAQNIIDWRTKNGTFRNREQLKEVKGIGAKSYEQCAGFVRILLQTCGAGRSIPEAQASTVKAKKGKAKEVSCHLNPLDSTWIHPESYDVAERIVKRCGADLRDIGMPRFIDFMRRTVWQIGLVSLSREMNVSEELTKLVTDGLTQPPEYDLRSEFKKPLFRRGVTSLEDLSVGDILPGIVRNTTHFGAFVDIGVGRDGLLPSGRLQSGMSLPQLGDKIEVKIVQVEVARKRITLDLVLNVPPPRTFGNR